MLRIIKVEFLGENTTLADENNIINRVNSDNKINGTKYHINS